MAQAGPTGGAGRWPGEAGPIPSTRRGLLRAWQTKKSPGADLPSKSRPSPGHREGAAVGCCAAKVSRRGRCYPEFKRYGSARSALSLSTSTTGFVLRRVQQQTPWTAGSIRPRGSRRPSTMRRSAESAVPAGPDHTNIRGAGPSATLPPISTHPLFGVVGAPSSAAIRWRANREKCADRP